MRAQSNPTLTQESCAEAEAGDGWKPVPALAHLVARLWETTPTFPHTHPRRDARYAPSTLQRVRPNRPPMNDLDASRRAFLSLTGTANPLIESEEKHR